MRAGSLVVVLASMIAAAPAASAQTMTLGEVLVLTPAASRPAPSPGVHVLQADRGSRKGQFLTAWSGRAADERPAPAGGGTEYALVAPAKAGAPPEVDVLGIHYLKVRPGRSVEFDRYVSEKVHPAVANLRPDLRLLYYKGVRGAAAGSYIAVFALTRASRDKYWPNGADSDDLRAAFGPVQPLTTELLTYLVDGSALTDPKFAAAVFESRDWSDFVLVPGR
jgi:hypothetical protein